MLKSNDDEIPGSTLGGAADKFVAELVDGRYVAVRAPGPLQIPSWQVVITDPQLFAASMSFEPEPGPPSIVDILIAKP